MKISKYNPRLLIGLTAALILAFVVLAGCSSTPTPSISASSPLASSTSPPTGTPTPTAAPSSTATPSPTPTPSPSSAITATPTFTGAGIYILTPWYNVPIPPGDVTVKISVTNFTLVNKTGQSNVAGQGHLIYYLDVTPPTAAGQPAAAAAGTFFETSDTSYTWTSVAAGAHLFSVQLVNNDGTSLNPPAFMTEPVPLQEPTPSPTTSATPSPSPTP